VVAATETGREAVKDYLDDFDAPTKSRLTPLVDNYQSAFLKLAKMTLATRDIVSDMEKNMALVPELLQELRQEIIALESRRHALFESQIDLINFNLVASAPIAIILTLLLMGLYWRNVNANKALSDASRLAIKERELSMTTLRSIGDGIIITDATGAITNANPVAEKLLGKRLAAINGCLVSDVIILQDQRDQSQVHNPVLACLQSKEIIVLNEHDIVIRRGDGTSVPIQNSVAPILDEQDQLIGTVMVIHDVTEQRELLQKIEHQAFHDPLTGLINRHALMRELDMAWNMSREHSSEHALVFIDLDRFKIVNDTCGHHAGDELLKGLTSLIRHQVRASDILSGLCREEGALGDALARVGGDEFALFLYECPLDAARRISLQIIEDIKEYVFVWDDQQFRVGASIGIAAMTGNNISINEVICHGIPGERVLEDGDIVNVDVTSILDGYYADANKTFFVGRPGPDAEKIVRVAREGLAAGIAMIRPGNTVGDIGWAIQDLAESNGCSVVREFVGHGVGYEFHEAPQIPHYGRRGEGIALVSGMVFTIEPMINLGAKELRVLSDNWTAVTRDGSLSAQFEQTLLVTEDGFESLTPYAL